jgi:TonB family protein
MNALAAFIVIAGLLFLSHPWRSPLALGMQSSLELEKRALADAQRIPAQELDPELPKVPFANWMKQTVGPGAGLTWQLSECGEIKDATADSGADIRACAEANTILADGRRVIVMITVGTFKKGVTGAPAFHYGVIERAEGLYRVRRLRDLPKLLSTSGSLPNIRARELPEVNMPSVRLAANNASSTGRPPWAGEDFGLLTPIEDTLPPPPEPPRTRPARSSSASNTEKQNDSGAVRQGAAVVKIQPTYPRGAKKFNASGTVEVQIMISVTGSVTAARATSGHPLLRKAAEEAARQWEFNPTTVNGDPIETQMVLSFVFKVPE